MKFNLPKGHKKLLHAWAFYDWANSVYSLVITSAIFPIFYTTISEDAFASGNVPDTLKNVNPESIIIITTALAFIVISIMSPLLSGIADYAGNKKRYMQFFCYLGGLSTIALAFFSFDYLWWSLLAYFTGLIGFWGSIVFYNSYLPDIALPEQQDHTSAKGYSLGYIGSVLLLVICFGIIQGGFYPENAPINAVQLSFILVGIWWMGFAQYTYAYLPVGTKKGDAGTKDIFSNGFKELKKIAIAVKSNATMKRYLSAFFVYSMAVQTVMLVATYFGANEVSWAEGEATTGLILSILMIQIVAVGGAFAASALSKKFGNIKVLMVINLLWAGICVYGYFVVTPLQFYVTAATVGLVMGSIQSLSRSTYSKLIPESSLDTASYFSFFDVTEKIGIVIGMILFAVVGELTGSMRGSILFLLLFFVIGVLLLWRIRKAL